MSEAAIATLETGRPLEGVAVVRLTDPPSASEWERIFDSLGRRVRDMPLVVLAGPGWLSTPLGHSMTLALVQTLRAHGTEVSIADV